MSSLSHAALDTCLRQLRQDPPADGLWQGLLNALPASEADLAALLLESYGVEMIPEEDLTRLELIRDAGKATASGQGSLWVTLNGRPMLLCKDPWERHVALASKSKAGACLALARPGQLERLLAKLDAQPPLAAPKKSAASGGDTSDVVQFVDTAIRKARDEGASDIHFETQRSGLQVKYRLDGVMAIGEYLSNSQQSEEVISRIKVMAQLDITERRRPQDGRIHWSGAGQLALDLRVSIMPSIFGEDAVLRLLDRAQLRHTANTMSLDALGFDVEMARIVRDLAGRPHGMLLVTGPTGSGKTTTVYAALSEVNDGLEKIITIEDPVEYELQDVLQIPVNEQKGLTFATGLRSILRHDPDKILVGEIRDPETAEIAVQSSLTGHLVFTTVHANSLFDVLGRFQHFNIDPFALASALNGVVVQRLLRRLCGNCLTWKSVSELELKCIQELKLPVTGSLPHAIGCEHCRGSGYKGRFVVAEVHQLTDRVRDMIVNKRSLTELREVIYRDSSSRLVAQAMSKVSQGMTTVQEVARVVGFD